MARYPKAQWVGASPQDFSTNKIQHKFIIIHVEEGTETGTDAWFHNPAAQVSAHFGVAKTGHVQQFVDTDDTAWAEGQWNFLGISVEHEGMSGQHLTPQQVQADKELFQWIHMVYKTRLALTFDPHDPAGGVIPHGKLPEGALSHPECPGQPIINDVHKLLNEMSGHLLSADENSKDID